MSNITRFNHFASPVPDLSELFSQQKTTFSWVKPVILEKIWGAIFLEKTPFVSTITRLQLLSSRSIGVPPQVLLNSEKTYYCKDLWAKSIVFFHTFFCGITRYTIDWISSGFPNFKIQKTKILRSCCFDKISSLFLRSTFSYESEFSIVDFFIFHLEIFGDITACVCVSASVYWDFGWRCLFKVCVRVSVWLLEFIQGFVWICRLLLCAVDLRIFWSCIISGFLSDFCVWKLDKKFWISTFGKK